MSETETENKDPEMDMEVLLQQQTYEKLRLYVLVAFGLIVCTEYYVKFLSKQKVRTSICSGWQFVIEVLNTLGESYRTFRMESHVFIKLANLLVANYGLHPTREMRAEEALAIFLVICAHNHSNRTLQTRFKHSGETISRKFNEVLTSLVAFSRDIIRPPDHLFKEVPSKIREDYKFWPHFEGCIGAIDGTHVRALDGKGPLMILAFSLQHRKSYKGKIYSHIPPQGKYYVVDAGYSNKKGYLAPFKGKHIRYHLPDFRRSTQPPTGFFEVFNYAHASLRNVIERSFEVWKNRWRILFNIPSYKFSTQCKVVVVTMTLHNYIRKNALKDEEFDKCDEDPDYMPNVEEEDDVDGGTHGDYQSNYNSGDTDDNDDDNDMAIVRNNIASSLMSRSSI
ncbi:uncharacterized protein LOC141651446 [Silene latifolia]|uniref:uncharacterized protein LOC141651446 n=1 Tax=Silene latifolia TaxID=37657 RepID=UPI003D76CCDE